MSTLKATDRRGYWPTRSMIKRYRAWSYRYRHALLIAGVAACVGVRHVPVLGDQAGPAPAGAAIASIFNPYRAPAERTMGLLQQQSFLDLIESSQRRLQLALVIDGTESMAEQIEAVRQSLDQMVGDLERYKSASVEYQLVVFRDVGAASGAVSFPLERANASFVADPSALRAAMNDLKVETGAPYFLESIDLGIHEAITRLGWSDDSDTTRWLLVFTDAAPYEEGFAEDQTGARRHYATDQLVSLATARGIRVSSILCTSRPQERDAYKKVLDRTRQFLHTLADGTGGLMLDLSYDDVREALAAAVQKEVNHYTKLPPITLSDIERERQRVRETPTMLAADRRVRIAVLPHIADLKQMTFDPSREEVRLATELRHHLGLLPGTQLKSPSSVQRQVEALLAAGIQNPDVFLANLASSLQVDYVVWGSSSALAGDLVNVSSKIYDLRGQQVLDNAVSSDDTTVLISRLVQGLASKASRGTRDVRLAALFASVPSQASPSDVTVRPVSNEPSARESLLQGLQHLEYALSYPPDSPEAQKLLDDAQAALEEARDRTQADDVAVPFTHYLLASVHYNRARHLLNGGRHEDAASEFRAFGQALKEAYDGRKKASHVVIEREIEADHLLLIQRNVKAAIAVYQELADMTTSAPVQSALRATWMLIGIYSGDWGVGQEYVDPQKAQELVVRILAHWPDSREAAFLRKTLRWDDNKGKNEYEYLPLENEAAAENAVQS